MQRYNIFVCETFILYLLNPIANPSERLFEHFLRLFFGSHYLFHFVLYAGHLRWVVNIQVVVDELDVLAGRERPVLAFNFANAHAAVELRHFVGGAVGAFALPGVVNGGGMFYLFGQQTHLLFLLVLYRVFVPLTQVHKENLVFAVAQLRAVVVAAFLVLVQNPKRYADIRGNEQLSGQNDDGFHLVVLYQPLADFERVAVVQCAVGQQETGLPLAGFKCERMCRIQA